MTTAATPEGNNEALEYSKIGTSGLILGLPVCLDSHKKVMENIETQILQRNETNTICITNTESMFHGLRTSSHRNFIINADISLCDGVGVIVAGAFWGLKVPRFNGPVLQLECSRVGVSKGWRHFYFGGKPGVANEMARRLRLIFPGLQVCGVYEPPFRNLTSDESAAVINLINQSKPDFVWVGLGLLKQEAWIAEFRDRLDVPWMIGVGAAFDYHSGAIPWAPLLIRQIGAEWLFRLVMQPRLRAKRYWWSAMFVLHACVIGLLELKFLKPRISNPANDIDTSIREGSK